MEKKYRSIVLESPNEEKKYEDSYLHLHSIGTDVADNCNFSRYTPQCDYLFTLILTGEGHYSYEAQHTAKKCFQAGDLLIFKPSEYFHIRSKKPINRIWFHIVGTAIPEILSFIEFDAKRHAIHLPPEICQNMSDVFDDLYATAKHNPHHSLRMNALIHNFLSYAAGVPTTDWIADDFKASLEYINKNYQQNIQIQTLADIAHLNHHYYIKQFKTLYGTTPYQYIMRKRFIAATTDLANTNLTIDEIASRNGFSNRIHFSQMFKKRYGLTPIEYRHQYR